MYRQRWGRCGGEGGGAGGRVSGRVVKSNIDVTDVTFTFLRMVIYSVICNIWVFVREVWMPSALALHLNTYVAHS